MTSSAARLIPGVDQLVKQVGKQAVQPLAEKFLKPALQSLPGIGKGLVKSGDEVMEGVAKNSPIMFKRVEPSVIDGIKYALDNNVKINDTPIDEKQVVRMFKNDELANIHLTGSIGKQSSENAANKASINNVIKKKTGNETVQPIITVSEELQSPKLKTLNNEKIIAHYDKTVSDIENLYKKKPGITEATDAKDSLDATINISGSTKNQDFYSKQKKLDNLGLRQKEVQGGESHYKQMHHELMKAVFAPFIRRARQLGSKMDVINLALIADEFGFGLGDQFSAIRQLDAIPHNEAHEFLKWFGIQPVPMKEGAETVVKKAKPKAKKVVDRGRNWLPETPGTTITREKIDIRGIQTIDELTARFKERIQELAIPMREEMEFFQDAWEVIPSSERVKLWNLKFKRNALRKVAKENPTKTNQLAKSRAEKAYSKLKLKLVKEMNAQVNFRKGQVEAVTEAASAKDLRKQMDAASPEDWTSRSNQPAQGPVTGGNPELTQFTQNLRKHGGLKEKT
tara:strand:+ start:140 stop:1672 length:1533 start_codon:yes stop_codon:yes gene_type:complete